MEWSNELVIEFLEIYEQEAVIWNPSHENHKDRNEIHDAWKRIQNIFSGEHSLAELKKKRDSLMATFRKLLTKVKSSRRTGTGTKDVFKPEWFAYNQMAKFLHEIYKPRRTTHSEETEESDNSEETETNASEAETPNEDSENSNASEIATPSASSSQSLTQEHNAFKQPPSKKRKVQSKMLLVEKRMDEAYKVLKSITEQPEQDECTLYTQLLAKQLRAFDENTRDVAMFEINNLMHRLKQSSYSRYAYSGIPSAFYASHPPFQPLYSQSAGFSQSSPYQSVIGFPSSLHSQSYPCHSPSQYSHSSRSQSSSPYPQTSLSQPPSPLTQPLPIQPPSPLAQPSLRQPPSPLTQPLPIEPRSSLIQSQEYFVQYSAVPENNETEIEHLLS